MRPDRPAEAEDDCTRVLAVEPRNAKALWRRATARRQLGRLKEALQGVLARRDVARGRAREWLTGGMRGGGDRAEGRARRPDLEAAASLEPANEEIKHDLHDLQSALADTHAAPAPPTPVVALAPSSPTVAAPTLMAAAKTVLPPPAPPSVAGRLPAHPAATVFEFEKHWREMKGDTALVHRYMKVSRPDVPRAGPHRDRSTHAVGKGAVRLVAPGGQSIPPARLSAVIGNSLDGDKLATILTALRVHGLPYAVHRSALRARRSLTMCPTHARPSRLRPPRRTDDPVALVATLAALVDLPRGDVNLLFLSKADRQGRPHPLSRTAWPCA